MCGWWPYGNELERIAGGKVRMRMRGEDDDDPFAHSGDEDGGPFALSGNDGSSSADGAAKDPVSQAVNFLRKSIDMEDKTGMVSGYSCVLGSGTEDQKVAVQLGREAKNCFELMRTDVHMKEYEGLGHWYSEDMLRNIFQFIKS
jgi:hypothetical protein